MPARAVVLALFLLLASCGGGISQAEVREARAAEHAFTQEQVMAVVRLEVDAHDYYEIVPASSDDDTVVTNERAFRDGAPWVKRMTVERKTQLTANEYVQLRVSVVEGSAGKFRVVVHARVCRTADGI